MIIGVMDMSQSHSDGDMLQHYQGCQPPSYITDLYATGSGRERICKLEPALAKLKNTIIGSNRRKTQALSEGILPQVLNLLEEVNLPSNIRHDACITLGSLVRGTPDNVKVVVASNAIPKLIAVLEDSDEKLISYSLSCLTTIFQHEVAPTDVLFTTPGLIPHLLILMNESVTNQVSVSTILSHSCKNRIQQDALTEYNIIHHLVPLLTSSHLKVQIPAVRCLTSLSHKNEQASSIIVKTRWDEKSIPDLLVTLMARDRPVDLQLSVAKALTYLHRSSALSSDDPRVLMKALPTLVRLCGKEHDQEIRAGAAETLAYLIEVDTELQSIAADSNHLIPTLADFLKPQNPTALFKASNALLHVNMVYAAFRAFGALGANDEGIRKRIIEREHLMDRLVVALDDSSEAVVLGAVHCLHSLSRSVHLLRTTFKDHTVWKPLMKLLQSSNEEILNVVSSTVCNLILEFSPAKEHILNEGALERFSELTRHPDNHLRINGIWALMNVAFQADEGLKIEIFKSLRDIGTDQLFRLLSDSDVTVVLKTLGLLRNLLSTPKHIDHIMDMYGTELMQAAILTLESDYGPDVKEQALCMLANIADGITSKDFIMMNEDVLKKLINYLNGNGNRKLQAAAVWCVSNLAWKEAEGSVERQAKLREIGIWGLLHNFIMTDDQNLFDRTKMALNQFK